jgi:hypothetical protein
MNKQKLNNYANGLTAAIHTIAVRTDSIITPFFTQYKHCVTASRTAASGITTSIINVNNFDNDVYCYTYFLQILSAIMQDAGITNYRIVRADFRIDSSDPTYYQAYKKLHRYLLSAIAVTYAVDNRYLTVDMITQQQLTVAIKNKYFEIEYYDKHLQSHGTDQAASRLELREKSIKNNKNLADEFVKNWKNRLDKSICNLQAVQTAYNDVLVDIYDRQQDSQPRQFLTVREFVTRYEECIFTRKQMIDLINRIDSKCSATDFAKNYKCRYGIEFYSRADMRYMVDIINNKIDKFFSN